MFSAKPDRVLTQPECAGQCIITWIQKMQKLIPAFLDPEGYFCFNYKNEERTPCDACWPITQEIYGNMKLWFYQTRKLRESLTIELDPESQAHGRALHAIRWEAAMPLTFRASGGAKSNINAYKHEIDAIIRSWGEVYMDQAEEYARALDNFIDFDATASEATITRMDTEEKDHEVAKRKPCGMIFGGKSAYEATSEATISPIETEELDCELTKLRPCEKGFDEIASEATTSCTDNEEKTDKIVKLLSCEMAFDGKSSEANTTRKETEEKDYEVALYEWEMTVGDHDVRFWGHLLKVLQKLFEAEKKVGGFCVDEIQFQGHC